MKTTTTDRPLPARVEALIASDPWKHAKRARVVYVSEPAARDDAAELAADVAELAAWMADHRG
ncbi:MAG: hypothetical protein ABI601_18585 [bacterium]